MRLTGTTRGPAGRNAGRALRLHWRVWTTALHDRDMSQRRRAPTRCDASPKRLCRHGPCDRTRLRRRQLPQLLARRAMRGTPDRDGCAAGQGKHRALARRRRAPARCRPARAGGLRRRSRAGFRADGGSRHAHVSPRAERRRPSTRCTRDALDALLRMQTRVDRRRTAGIRRSVLDARTGTDAGMVPATAISAMRSTATNGT